MVADRVEFDLTETGGGEGGGKLGLEFGILESRGFLRGNLDEGLFAKMAHTDDSEAVSADDFLGFFNGGEAVRGNGKSGSEAGGKAGGSRFFGDFQSGLPGQGSDIGLGKPGFAERCGHGEFAGGGAAGSEFAGVVKVFPVGQNGHASELGEFLHA